MHSEVLERIEQNTKEVAAKKKLFTTKVNTRVIPKENPFNVPKYEPQHDLKLYS